MSSRSKQIVASSRRRMAIHVLYLLGSRPKGLVLGFMAATGFLSMWISNTATAAVMLPILAATAVKIGVHPFLLMIPPPR